MNIPGREHGFKTFSCNRYLTTVVHSNLSSATDAGAWLVTMATPSLGLETTVALVLAQMGPKADASLPIAVTKTLLLYSSHVSVSLDLLVSNVLTL